MEMKNVENFLYFLIAQFCMKFNVSISNSLNVEAMLDENSGRTHILDEDLSLIGKRWITSSKLPLTVSLIRYF